MSKENLADAKKRRQRKGVEKEAKKLKQHRGDYADELKQDLERMKKWLANIEKRLESVKADPQARQEFDLLVDQVKELEAKIERYVDRFTVESSAKPRPSPDHARNNPTVHTSVDFDPVEKTRGSMGGLDRET